jgi:hypothetical protein
MFDNSRIPPVGQFRARYAIVLRKDDGTVVKTDSASKRRIANLAWGERWQNATMTVTYYADGRALGCNRGRYAALPDLLAALAAFSESDVLLSVLSGWAQ